MKQTLKALLILLALGLFSTAPLNAANNKLSKQVDRVPAKLLFGKVTIPNHADAQSIGGYADGCLAGAAELPLTDPAEKPAWQVMRPSRNRNWGNPELIAFLEKLAREARDAGEWPGLLVGDMAQPRGGPMLTGHASHQIGLDADIWLTPMPDRILSRKERETISARSMVLDHYRIDPKAWSDGRAALIARAAKNPELARIFVHPPIKKAICEWAKANGTSGKWLAKIRPYYGHTYHFHVRLACPKGNKGCKNQNPPAPADGTGCGQELSTWLSKDFWARRQPAPPSKPIKPAPPLTLAALPMACRTVLNSP